jgi:hypothetical protein
MRGLGDIGSVGALLVGARPLGPGELYRQGMADLGVVSRRQMGAIDLDQITGGALTKIQGQLDQVALALKISTAAAIGSAVIAMVASALSYRRR